MSTDTADEPATGSSSYAQLGWMGDTRWATLDRSVSAVVVLLMLVPLWNLGGLAGALAWLAIAGSWLLFPPVIPVVFGQFVLVALTPADTPLTSLLPAEGALFALLAVSFLDSGAWLPASPSKVVGTRQNLVDTLGYIGAASAMAALVVYAIQASGLMLAGGLCLGIILLIALVLRPAISN